MLNRDAAGGVDYGASLVEWTVWVAGCTVGKKKEKVRVNKKLKIRCATSMKKKKVRA